MTITDHHIENNIKPNTKMVVLGHANNLVGTFYDIEKIGQITKNIIYFLWSMQLKAQVKKYRCAKDEYRYFMRTRS